MRCAHRIVAKWNYFSVSGLFIVVQPSLYPIEKNPVRRTVVGKSEGKTPSTPSQINISVQPSEKRIQNKKENFFVRSGRPA